MEWNDEMEWSMEWNDEMEWNMEWNDEMEWNMEWNGECTQLPVTGTAQSRLQVLSFSNSHVITCDRDEEKIRVSRYPNAYNIETFCLGHTE